MKRLAFSALGLLALASLLLAQATTPATLRLPSGDRPVSSTQQSGATYFAADEIMAALGGSMAADSNGFKVTLHNTVAAFGPDSRFAVVRDDLIEMPVAPIVVDGRAYAPWQFYQGFLARASQLDVAWDPAARVLQVKPATQNVAGVQLSVANVQGISKVVITLSAPMEYSIAKEPGAFTIRFRGAIRAPYVEQAHEDDPNVTKTSFVGSDLRIDLSGPDVVGDAYRLENPFRVVVDLRKGQASAPGVPPQAIPSRPVDLPGIRTIVIDPGHGGKEVGAIGPGGLMEKDATLNLCRRLAAALESKLKTRVILTRSDDSVVALDQRTSIANQYKADLFLSVHMNAAIVKGAHGAETYFLSLEASDELAKKAAELENAAAGGAPQNPATDLKLILWDLAQQDYLNESSKLAQDIQEEMNRITGVQSRGVKQAPFRVLVGATMPAALVEVAFITNPEEEARINSDAFQKTVVDALTTAVERYKLDYETRIGVVHPPAPPATTTAAPVKKAGT